MISLEQLNAHQQIIDKFCYYHFADDTEQDPFFYQLEELAITYLNRDSRNEVEDALNVLKDNLKTIENRLRIEAQKHLKEHNKNTR